MDWNIIIQQQETLKKSFLELQQAFEQAARDFEKKNEFIVQKIFESQQNDANMLMNIHKSLQAIIESTHIK